MRCPKCGANLTQEDQFDDTFYGECSGCRGKRPITEINYNDYLD